MANGKIGMRDIKEVFRLDEMGFAKLKIHQITVMRWGYDHFSKVFILSDHFRLQN